MLNTSQVVTLVPKSVLYKGVDLGIPSDVEVDKKVAALQKGILSY